MKITANKDVKTDFTNNNDHFVDNLISLFPIFNDVQSVIKSKRKVKPIFYQKYQISSCNFVGSPQQTRFDGMKLDIAGDVI